MPRMPKPPELRQRRNKTSTAAKLPAEGEAVSGGKTPKLPPRKPGWCKQVKDFWAEIWSSPMRGELLKADLHGLHMLMDLWHRYWTAESGQGALAAEIRLQRQCFGLTPLDRRRLQWEIARGEEAERRRKTERPAAQKGDPRLPANVTPISKGRKRA